MGNITGILCKGNKTRDWSGLLPELVAEIADRLVLAEDYAALRGVCTSWRAAAGKNQFVYKPPLLMLSRKDDSDDRELYSFSERKICWKVSLPEANGSVCLNARFGWLVTLAKSSEMSLLNPISRARFKLPNPFPRFLITAATLSANPSDNSSDFVLMIIAHSFLEFWRPGDTHWTRVLLFCLESLCYCKDGFYAIDRRGKVYLLNPDRLDDYSVVATLPGHLVLGEVRYKRLYLVGSSDGELILITRETNRFEVIQIDVMKGNWKVMSGLEKDAVFIGYNNNFYVRDANNPNCIYFTDDENANLFKKCGVRWVDTGVYNIQNRSIQGFESRRSAFPPLWVDSSIIFSD